MMNGINKIPMNQRKDNRFWKFVMGDDLDFYEEYTIHLTDEEQEKFFDENPDFMSEFPVSRDKMYLLRDPVFRGILRKIKEYKGNKNMENNYTHPNSSNAKTYNVNQVIWDNDFLKVTYVGITKQGNFWGIKMLVENKRNTRITLQAHRITMDDDLVTDSAIIINDLLPGKMIFAEASMMFYTLEEMGINSIEQMLNIKLTLTCEALLEQVATSPRITLCPQEYNSGKSNLKTLVPNNTILPNVRKNTNCIYVSKKGDTIYDNEYVGITYLGVFKGSNYWGIRVLIENKSVWNLSIEASNIEMDNLIVIDSQYIVVDQKPHSTKETYIYLLFDTTNELGVKQIEDFNDIKIKFCCKRKEKSLAKKTCAIIHPIDLLKGAHDSMTEIINEIEQGIVWDFKEDAIGDTLFFDFVYPNGKHGDVDLYLISQYGDFKQKSAILFSAQLPTKKLHIIELMVMFYYTRFSQNALLVNRENNEDAVAFLNKYNNIMRLNQLFDATANEMDRQEMLDSEVMQRAYHIIKAKYQELKEERSAVYAELVANNSTTSKWKSEQQVYAIVRETYDDAIYQFHADWLGRQSLDVYIPSLNLAIEYQGQQHYEPLEIFGGKEKFNLQQQQDLKKKKLCAENNITLVEWKYDIKPSKRNLNELLKPYIK